MILLNADIGERGPSHPLDCDLMDYIDIANIACGGHAGNRESIAAFASLAEERGVRIAAHLSYPDREGFGRRTVTLSLEQLLHSLDEQLALMPETRVVKFNGALYHDSGRDEPLAAGLCEWLRDKKVDSVIVQQGFKLADCCITRGIKVLTEGFAERRYVLSAAGGRLSLVDRRRPEASITDLEEAVKQVRTIVEEGKVTAFTEESSLREVKMIDIEADTICIHSDSGIALELARAAREILDAKYGRRSGGD
jgi:UPF0271 protein